jgi:hypothetical protein
MVFAGSGRAPASSAGPCAAPTVSLFRELVTFHATRPALDREEATHRARSEPVEQGPTAMSAVSGGGNYISDGQIMAWLATQQDRIYGELKENMDTANERGDFIEELNKIKSDLHAANKSKDFTQVDAELQAFMDKYESDPRFTKLVDGLKGIADRVHQDLLADLKPNATPVTATPHAQQAFIGPHGATTASPGQTVPIVTKAWVSPNGTKLPVGGDYKPKTKDGYSDDQMKDWDDLISSKADLANKNDQLTMIHIQELRSTLDQSSQLASSFISSGDKTSSAIINNIA